MRSKFPVLLLLFMMSTLVSQESGGELSKYVSGSVLDLLLQEGHLQKSSIHSKDWKFELLPQTELARTITAGITPRNYSTIIENIYLYKKRNPNISIASCSEIVRKISELEGLEYYSTSRKKNRILYEKSYVIRDSKSKERIDDPVSGSADGLHISVLQKDLNFGENIYSYRYFENTQAVAFICSNEFPLSYSFFKVFDANSLKVCLLIEDAGEYLLVYVLTSAYMKSIPGFDGKIVSSFSTRAEAVYNWFIKHYVQY